MKKIIKRFFQILIVIVAFIAIVGVIFMYTSPQFGGKVSEKDKELFAQTGHYSDGKFTNKEPLAFEVNCHSVDVMLDEAINPVPDLGPKTDIKVLKISEQDILNYSDTLISVVWFGHSTFLLKISGKLILADPVFSQTATPHPWLGRKRYNSEMPISIENLPPIDMVVISHDHYDHLDYSSIVKLRDKVKKFVVPLGIGSHLRAWKVNEDKIHELDWWQEYEIDGLRVAHTPSRHMSGRGFSDEGATLWGGWVFIANNQKAYYTGDGGYGQHFKEIGEKYGPFDIGIMECGQYNKLWKFMHMSPEQSVQAAIDVRAHLIMPVHWGAFTMASHGWKDPIERVTKEAEKLNRSITTPQIGEAFYVKDGFPTSDWWVEID